MKKESELWAATANEIDSNNAYNSNADARQYWSELKDNKELSNREKALDLKKTFPTFSVNRMIQATEWKRYKWWILPDEQRSKIERGRSKYRNKRKELITKIKKDLSGCSRCGYNICDAALEFHHLDPAEKDSAISSLHKTEDIIKEAEKCVLLCSNCHRELHAGLFNL